MRFFFFFSSRRRHTRSTRDWSSDVCSSDLRLRSSRRPDSGLPRRAIGNRRSIRRPDRGAEAVIAGVAPVPRRREGTIGEILKLAAFLRRDFLIAASYRLSFVSEFTSVVVGVVMFALVGRMVDLRVLPSYGGVHPTYMEYVATGLVLGAFVQVGV